MDFVAKRIVDAKNGENVAICAKENVAGIRVPLHWRAGCDDIEKEEMSLPLSGNRDGAVKVPWRSPGSTD